MADLGRPSDFTQETADLICERIADGISLRTICLDAAMPNKATVFRWLGKYAAFSDQYARAREAQADTLFDESLDIADDGSNDWVERLNHNGADKTWEVNGEALARSKLRIDTRKWMAGKLRPKKYGEKLELDQTIGVTDALGSLMQRIATEGKRLSGGTTVSPSAVSSSSGEQELAPEGENDVQMWAKQRQRILNDLVKETGLTPDQISPANVEDRLRTEIMAKRSQP